MTVCVPGGWEETRARSDAAVARGLVMPREIRTERLQLAPFALHQLGDFHRFWSDADSTRFMGGARDISGTFQTMARFTGQWWLHGFGAYALTERATGALLGYAGLWYPADKPEVEIAYGLLPEGRGRGVCAEAVRAIRAVAEAAGAASLVSYIAVENVASQRVAAAAGAERDGRQILFGGHLADVWRYPCAGLEPAAADANDREVLLEARAMPLYVRTPRLELVPWRPDHEPHAIRQMADAEVMRHLGGARAPGEASRIFIGEAGHWILRGYGYYAVEHDGEFVGAAGLYHPAGWPEAELGYNLCRDAWGRGFATEAAGAVRAVAAEQGRTRLVSFIDDDNAASQAVARRLGAVREGTATFPNGETCAAWRYPMPDGMSDTSAARRAA